MRKGGPPRVMYEVVAAAWAGTAVLCLGQGDWGLAGVTLVLAGLNVWTSRLMPGLPRLARCSQGYLGIVVGHGRVVYRDGSEAMAWRGRHFPKLWRRWSSRDPRWGWRA